MGLFGGLATSSQSCFSAQFVIGLGGQYVDWQRLVDILLRARLCILRSMVSVAVVSGVALLVCWQLCFLGPIGWRGSSRWELHIE